MAYIGKSPDGTGVRSRFYFTATGGETSLSGTDDNNATLVFADGAYVDVYLNGVLLVAGTDYNTSTANTIAGLTALAANDIVEILVFDIFTVADTVSASAGGTFSANVSFTDNSKAIFGAGSDLQVFHDGTHSYVQDAGTGSLRILAENFAVMNAAETENMILAVPDAAVTLMYNGNTKLQTASTGVDVTGTVTADGLTVDTNTLVVDAANNRVGVGDASPDTTLHINSGATNTVMRVESTDGTADISFLDGNTTTGDNSIRIGCATDDLRFTTNSTERMRITNAGSVFVNTTTGNTTSGTNGGIVLNNVGSGVGRIDVGNTGTCFNGNRSGSHGDIYVVRYQGARRGALMTSSTTGQACLQGGNVGITFTTNGRLNPTNSSGAASDNAMDLGQSDKRFDDIFATNGTIQTSDQNEKQQIASLTSAEMTAAKAISALFKTFKWNDKVAAKGDAARRHAGVIAQEVQTAMTNAGLDAADYAFWCSDTWWETDEVQTDDEGVEHSYKMPYYTADEAPEGATQRTRLGIRYPELLAFVGAATEQRLADLETRLTALENA